MNGSHGEKTPSLTARDMKGDFKGTSEVIKDGKELRDWQKVYQKRSMTQKPSPARRRGGDFLGEFLAEGLKGGKSNLGRG